MTKKINTNQRFEKLKAHLYKVPIFFVTLILSSMWAIPMLVNNQAAAGQITTRTLALLTAKASASTVYSYTFTNPTAGSIQSIKFVACNGATQTYGLSGATLTGCTAPTGLNINGGTQNAALTAFGAGVGWTSTTGFTRQASNVGDCDEATNNNVLCITRTSATSEPSNPRTITWNTQVNPSVSGSFFIGIYTYSDNAFATPVDSGTVASSVATTLQITATVAEVLNFCVGTTADDQSNDATAETNQTTTCSNSTVGLGTLTPGSISTSPVATANGGTNTNGLAILDTNALNGSSVSYDAIQDGGTTHSGALRLTGQNCTTFPTDCIPSIGSQAAFTGSTYPAGIFGMTVAGTNCGYVTTNSLYSGGGCAYNSGTEHLVPSSGYVGKTGSFCASCNTADSGNGFAWVETNTATTPIAAAASGNAVAYEALILKFAAEPSVTTTFGNYTVSVDFVAAPTY